MSFVWEDTKRLTFLSVEGLTNEDVEKIYGVVRPAKIWREGNFLIVWGYRDLYEFYAVKGRRSPLTRLTVALDSTQLPFLPTEENRVY